MMEYWIEKLEGIDLLFLSLSPSLQHSIIPILQGNSLTSYMIDSLQKSFQ
jgi:hypothetical protein